MTHPTEIMLRRLSPFSPEDVDDLAAKHDPRYNPTGRAFFPEGVSRTIDSVPFRNPNAVFIGFRIREARTDLTTIALQLGGLAIEHETEIIILSDSDYSGLERFGFRTERISGETEEERAECEQQIRRFWGLEAVLG